MNIETQLDLFSLEQVESDPVFQDIQSHIVRAFWKFHKENAHVFVLFRDYCHRLRATGRTKYGSKAVMERIRWHLEVDTDGEDFKLNNNYTSCYTRLLIMHEPEFAEFFTIRGTLRAS